MPKVAYLLSLIEGFDFRLGRRDLHVWSPTPLEGFSCKSFLGILLDPSFIEVSLWRIMEDLGLQRKSSSFLASFPWLCQHGG